MRLDLTAKTFLHVPAQYCGQQAQDISVDEHLN